MWPDFTKFRHFGKIVNVFGNFLMVYFLFGNYLDLLWQILDAIGQISFEVNGQIWENAHLVTLLGSNKVSLSTGCYNKGKISPLISFFLFLKRIHLFVCCLNCFFKSEQRVWHRKSLPQPKTQRSFLSRTLCTTDSTELYSSRMWLFRYYIDYKLCKNDTYIM